MGRGTLRIEARDFARQLRTFRITGAGSIGRRIKAAAAFGRFFAGSLYDTYGGVLTRRSALDPQAEPRVRRELRAEAPEVHGLVADDDVALRLLRYRGGERGPVLLVHGLGMASSVFTLDTIETNLVEYLTEAGFDTWLLDSRVSIDLDVGGAGCTADDVALRDVPAAVAKVREVVGADGIDVVAHGFGALTVLMSLVEGLDGVRSLLSS
ncbi:MAG: alpha/beta hydrolase, partial [Actinobacteria bacterium]|nr:alpha/beta hydrolase [Actinomycetota bacterium]